MTHLSHDEFVRCQLLDAAIARHGFAVIAVGHGGCSVPGCCGPTAPVPWTYTVGLSQVGAPELVLLGLDQVSAHLAVSWVATETLAGRPVALEHSFSLRDRGTKVLEVPDEWLLTDPDRMGGWFADREYHARPSGLPRVHQVVWADDEGRYPDDPSCRPSIALDQPILRDDPFSIPHRTSRAVRRTPRSRRRIA